MANLLVSDKALDKCGAMHRGEKSLSRYFDLDSWFDNKRQELQLEELSESTQKICPFLYVPKPSKAEKEMGLETLEKQYAHVTVKPVELTCILASLGSRQGDIVLDPT